MKKEEITKMVAQILGQMQLPEPIRSFGVTEVAIKLHPKVTGKFNVHVVEE